MPSPDVSDEEDAPDYDNILAVPTGDGSSLATRPRSQRSSYADLQRLRRTSSAVNTNGTNGTNGLGGPLSPLSPVEPTGAASGEKHTDADGLHFRGQTRARKAGLSDSVPVGVIGEIDREEAFKDAMKDLNSEMKKQRSSQDDAA